jgi:hypothetical protein
MNQNDHEQGVFSPDENRNRGTTIRSLPIIFLLKPWATHLPSISEGDLLLFRKVAFGIFFDKIDPFGMDG